jgi:NitT/TauT family transport system substrate-binding protein
MRLVKQLVTTVWLVWLVSLLGCARPGSDAPTNEHINVRLKWLHQAQFAGFYTAAKKDFYTDQHLQVSINPGGVDFPAIQMVASGNEQFGVTGADQILLAREQHIPVVAVAVIYRKSPMVFFSLAGSGITTPMHFRGKKVGVKLGGNEELTYRALLRMTHIDPQSITEVPVKYDMSPFFSRAIDIWPGYVINEAIVAKEKGQKINIIWPADYGVRLYADTLFTTEALIREKPDLVRRFVGATLKGWEYAAAHQDEAVTYTLLFGDGLSKEHEAAMMAASVPLLKPDKRPIGSMDAASWEHIRQMLLDTHFLKTPVDLKSSFNESFLPD